MQVLCGQCGSTLDVDDGLAGGSITCVKCGHTIPVPALGEGGAAALAAGAVGEEDEGFASQARAAIEKKIRVLCGSCGRGLSVSARMAGKQVKCPSCQASIQIPDVDEEEELARGGVKMIPLDTVEPVAVFHPQVPPPAAAPHTEPEPQALPRRKLLAMGVIAVVVVGAIIAGVVIYDSLANQRPRVSVNNGRPPTATPMPQPATQVAVATPSPTEVPPTTPPASTPTPPPTPAPLACTASMTSASLDVFADSGYYPAMPGRYYMAVTANIDVQSGELKLIPVAPDVVLEVARPPAEDGKVEKDRYPCIGVRADRSLAPIRADTRPIIIRAGQSRQLVLLFDVPLAVHEGHVLIRGVDDLEVGPIMPPPEPPPNALAGTYVESPPRNLKPMLKDPIMAALQSAPGAGLIVVSERKGLTLAIPSAGVTGNVKHIGGALFDADLAMDRYTLKCKLRLIEQGNGVILYLAESPMCQLTFRK
ncbi:MAG: hypothetical protein ACE15C_11810 [Phycisphaerae bacterium]